MSNADVVLRFVKQLRAEDEKYPLDPSRSYRRLADHLEYRVAHPSNDRFDIPRTGDEAQDREALARWLDNAARDPPFLAPSWGRTFSELMAWHVRHDREFNDANLTLALSAMREAHAKVSRARGELMSVMMEEFKRGVSPATLSPELARSLDGLDQLGSNDPFDYGPLWRDRPAAYLLFSRMRPFDEVQSALTSLSHVLQSTADLHRSIELLSQGLNWRPHLLAVVAVLLSPSRASYTPRLWRMFDDGSWLAPQLAATLYVSDPEFCREAKQRILSRCLPGPQYLDAHRKQVVRSKSVVSLLRAMKNLPSEAGWVAEELQHADIQALITADSDASGEIVDLWLEAVRTQFTTFGSLSAAP